MNFKRVACIFILLIFSFIVDAQPDTVEQSLDNWFDRQPGSAKYVSIKAELLVLFSSAYTKSLPLKILFERLQEGASKNVPANRLLMALKEETNRLAEIMTMINTINALCYEQRQVYFFSGFKAGDPAEEKDKQKTLLEDLMHQLSILNRGGISVQSMSSLFTLAVNEEKPDKTIFLVLHGLIKIPGLNNLKDEEIAGIGIALIKSSLSPESYGTLASIFVKGRTYNLNYSIITSIVIEELQRGGGLVQIEQEIIRRGRKR
ncbi:MAG: hypothetical protein JXB88_14405 [Spirochaetales bacterium]|nr:hypothetical protein [Spirochaetales bacterium]